MLEAVHVQQQTNKSFTFMWPLSIHKYFKIVVPGLTDVNDELHGRNSISCTLFLSYNVFLFGCAMARAAL